MWGWTVNVLLSLLLQPTLCRRPTMSSNAQRKSDRRKMCFSHNFKVYYILHKTHCFSVNWITKVLYMHIKKQKQNKKQAFRTSEHYLGWKKNLNTLIEKYVSDRNDKFSGHGSPVFSLVLHLANRLPCIPREGNWPVERENFFFFIQSLLYWCKNSVQWL